MALNDKSIQELQKKSLTTIRDVAEKSTFTTDDGKEYYLIYKINSTTQAIAVAPVVGKEQYDYTQTTIIVAGTQTPGGINTHVGESFYNAGVSTIFGLTVQTKDIDEFYLETSRRIKSEDGFISNMSGHSQAGPGTAKTAAKYSLQQESPIKVTNFMDFAAKRAVQTNNFSKEEMDYLDKYATIYRDSRGDIVNYDMQGGDVPYGKTMKFEVVEGEDGHSPRTPKMKGNSLDVEWYYKRNRFATGMTEKQVRKIAEYKAKTYKVNVAIANYGLEMDKVTPEYYVREYLKEYGDFAPEPSKQELLTLKRRRIDELHASLKTTTGSQMISLREELVRTSAQTAQLQAEVYEQAIKDKLANAKESVSQHITELRSAAYTLAHNLSGGEIEGLLSELSFELAWNTGIEAATLSSANSYQKEMTSIAGKLNKAADRIVEIDQKGSQIFGEL